MVIQARAFEGVAARCQQQWPNHDAQRRACVGRHQDGAKRFVAFAEALRNQSAPVQSGAAKTLQKCASGWWDKHGYNFVMVMYCLRKSTDTANKFW